MAKFVLAYHGGAVQETEEEQAAAMTAWTDWFRALGPAVVDPGNPVGRAKMVGSDGSVTEGGGPNPVTGYTVISAADFDAAADAAKGCPILAGGGTVEVGEIVELM
jgi:hypothetical protein